MKTCPSCGYQSETGTHCPSDGTLLQGPPTPDRLVGTTLRGRYKLDQKLATGGMGSVYRATNVATGATVAVKVLLDALSESDEHVARFRQEAELLSRILHPNVVTLLDYGAEGGTSFMVMEFLSGSSLEEVVPQGGLEPDQALAILEEICAGVGAAHAAGLVHRDLKPENIIMAHQPDGRSVVKVIDFGLARPLQEAEALELTVTGRVVGSAGYVAPEHITGGRAFNSASDIYALGAVLYFLLTGRRPYDGDNIPAIMTAQLRGQLPPLDLPAGSRGALLEGVVKRAMNRDPSLRYPSTGHLLSAARFVLKDAGQLGRSRTNLNTVSLSNLTIQLQAAPTRRGPAPRVRPVTPRNVVLLVAGGVAALVSLGGVAWVLTQRAERRAAPAAVDVAPSAPAPPAKSPGKPPRRRR
ncbi:MAG: serine/threonine protein kinase [Deltaproteobacteria bacterium]|nr:serine/threonine protein kinase [Deltaproteobacteria bacterium]